MRDVKAYRNVRITANYLQFIENASATTETNSFGAMHQTAYYHRQQKHYREFRCQNLKKY